MAIQSDARGFLIGDPIELGRKSSDISHISEDVSAIRRTISERWHGYTRPSPSASPARDASGKFTSASTVKVAVPNSSKSSDGTTAAAGNAVVAERIRRVSSGGGAELPGRDSAGRFTAGGSSASNKAASVIASIGDRLSRLTAVTSGIDDADPAVKAAREVAEPLRRGFEFFQGDKQTSWLKKIFSKLSFFQKEESVYNRTTKETLEKIERKPVSSVGGGSSWLNKIPGIAAASSMLGMAGGGIAKAGIGALGLLKRVPVLGALLGAAGAAFDIYGSESDGSLSRRDKDQAAGKSIGGWMGTLGGVGAGALAGSMLGPVGTIVGGIVGGFLGDQAGQIIGYKFGGWVADMREADIPGKISSAWEGAVLSMSATFTESWTKVKDIGGLVMDVIGEQLGGMADYIKGATGIDIKQQGAAWLERTKASFNGAVDYTKQAAASLVDKTMQGVDWASKNTTAGNAIKNAVNAFQGTGINGLTTAQFAALAADTRRTESSGKTTAENKYGYLGRR
ncbi:hypothetical protein [Methylomonas sp. DH-1]|uniref:hypothetical protein n=1 Tax=Methylomonas sp. (strain DH-1) TaxID=1727196 RepID=UPI0007C97480|nr:hypothetical protein [Methylomonas sp. DH-1]ANE54466.1 hypothetical protein AYM39_04195 [Methylomonas sp. DH-1]